jgi:hypothetical protein
MYLAFHAEVCTAGGVLCTVRALHEWASAVASKSSWLPVPAGEAILKDLYYKSDLRLQLLAML